MSSNKTTNYQLHLWEPEDDFIRSEFNENNEAIDAALAENRDSVEDLSGRISRVKLLEVITTENCQQVDVDVSQFDWTAWEYVELFSCMPGNVQNTTMVSYLRVNGGSTNVVGIQNVLYNNFSHGLFCRARLKWHSSFFFADYSYLKAHVNSQSTVLYENGTGNGAVLLTTAPVELSMVLNTTNMTTPSNNYYLPGSRLTFWGVK